MPTIEELTKQFETLNSSVSLMKKDFDLKLESAKKDAESWKTIATQKEEDIKKFKAEADKAIEDKNKAFAESRKQETASFLENLKKAGKISPAMQETATKLMETMNTETVVHTFEAKDGKKVSHTQFSLFKELLSSLSTTPIFRSMTQSGSQTKETPAGGDASEKSFTVVKTKAGDQTYEVDGQELHAAALQYQEDQRKSGRTVDYASALIEAEKIMKQAA